MLYFLQQLLNGVHSGALYALLAFGYALTNGVLHRTNLAYGALFAFCGQTMILVAVFGWYVLWLTLPMTVALGMAAAFAYAWLVGKILARHVFAPLAGSAPNTIVAATLGVALVLMELARVAADTRDLWLPPLLSAPVIFVVDNGFRVTLTQLQLINCAICVLAIVAAARALACSRFGREWKAVSDDPAAAELCGVDTARTFRQTIVAGGFAAALAGVLAGLYFGNISFGTGLVFGLKILFVTAVGGYRDPVRAAIGAGAFGIAESLWTGYFAIEWRDAWMFLFLVALLALRPAAGERTAAP